jgi:hypothetical protein
MASIEAAAMIESRKRKETADKVGKRRPILKLAWPAILSLGDIGKARKVRSFFVTSHELSIIFSREKEGFSQQIYHHPSSKPTCWSLEWEDGPCGFLRSGSLITQARLVSLNGGLIIIAVVWCLMAVGTFLFTWSIVQPGQPTARRAEESRHLTYYIWRVKQNRLSWLRTPPVEAEEGWGCPALVN